MGHNKELGLIVQSREFKREWREGAWAKREQSNKSPKQPSGGYELRKMDQDITSFRLYCAAEEKHFSIC